MAIYMIDYENVKTGGLNGISRLTAEDRVIIFYSENANRLTFDLHRRLMESPAQIEYREVTVGGHNALDFQLVTYLGYLIAQNPRGQYLIISYDRGFEYVVNFWRKDGLCIGLLPYLKDPSYALQKASKGESACGSDKAPKQEEVAEELVVEFVSDEEDAAEEPVQQAVEELPAETLAPAEEIPAEDAPEATPAETVAEEAPAAETPIPAEEPVQEETASVREPEPVQEEPAPVPSVKKKSSSRKKPASKKLVEKKEEPKPATESKPAQPEHKAEEKKPEDKSTRSLPSVNELRTILGDLVADDPETRFVRTALEKYKTKLGLNNGLVKHFGNQRAGEIYQKVKPFVAQKKDR